MYLKRIYKPNDDPEAAPELDYISLGHTGFSPEQNFSVKLVTGLLEQGIMEISGDELIFHVHPEDLHYEILRTPGRYCLHCGEKLTDDATGQMARLHIAQEHAGEESPDPGNPSGYVAINYFECRLDAQQHAKFQKLPGQVAVSFPRKDV